MTERAEVKVVDSFQKPPEVGGDQSRLEELFVPDKGFLNEKGSSALAEMVTRAREKFFNDCQSPDGTLDGGARTNINNSLAIEPHKSTRLGLIRWFSNSISTWKRE